MFLDVGLNKIVFKVVLLRYKGKVCKDIIYLEDV